MLPLLIYVFVFFLGASIGSFINVVVHRIPMGLSLIHPHSHCPRCYHTLHWANNIPVFSWFWLNGRCGYCGVHIPFRYPLVEGMTGFLFLVLLLKFGISWITLGNWLLFSWLLALAIIDLDTLTLPHPLTTSGLGMGLVFQVVSGLGGSSVGGNEPLFVHPMTSLMAGIEGAVLGIWLWDTIRVLGSVLLGRTAMGGGDANLSAMIGAWLGWKQLLLAGLIACWFGAMIGGIALATRLIHRHQPIPFGPFLALGAAIAAIWGHELLGAYFSIFWRY